MKQTRLLKNHKTIRRSLLAVEGIIGVSVVAGGAAILAGVMRDWLPVEWLQGSPFSDYRLPAVALILGVGGSNLLATSFLLRRRDEAGAIASFAAGAILTGFEIVEALSMGYRMWLQPFCFAVGLLTTGLAVMLARPGQIAGKAGARPHHTG